MTEYLDVTEYGDSVARRTVASEDDPRRPRFISERTDEWNFWTREMLGGNTLAIQKLDEIFRDDQLAQIWFERQGRLDAAPGS